MVQIFGAFKSKTIMFRLPYSENSEVMLDKIENYLTNQLKKGGSTLQLGSIDKKDEFVFVRFKNEHADVVKFVNQEHIIDTGFKIYVSLPILQ